MSILSNKWTPPSGIRWNSSIGGSGLATSTKGTVQYNKTLQLQVVFSSGYSSFQMISRSRKRLGPLNPDVIVGSLDTEQWTEWTAWSNVAEDTPTPTTRLSSTMVGLSQIFEFPYAISEYDALETEFAIRAYDPASNTHSAWDYQTLRIDYAPSFSIVSNQLNFDGTITIDYQTNWNRENNTVQFFAMRSSNKRMGSFGYQTISNLPANSGSFIIPQSYLGSAQSGQAITPENLTFLTSDGISTSGIASYPFTVNAQGQGTSIQKPTLATTINEDKSITVTATRPGGTAYTDCKVWLTYTDRYRNTHSIDAETGAITAGTKYQATFIAPPFGIDLQIRVGVVNAAGFDFADATEQVDSGGAWMWSSLDGQTHVAIYYGVSFNPPFEAEIEFEKPAGRSRPLSRRGIGGTRSMQISGNIYAFARGQDEPPYSTADDFLNLEKGTSWIFRTPTGLICKVEITRCSMPLEGANPMHAVDVVMQEVS